MQAQSSTLLRCPHMSMSPFFCHWSQNLWTQPFQVHETCGIQCTPICTAVFPDVHPHSLRASVAAANLGVYKWVMKQKWLGSSGINHYIKAEMGIIHGFLSPGKVLIKRTAWPPEPHSILGRNPWAVFLRPGGNIRRFLLRWTLSNKL